MFRKTGRLVALACSTIALAILIPMLTPAVYQPAHALYSTRPGKVFLDHASNVSAVAGWTNLTAPLEVGGYKAPGDGGYHVMVYDPANKCGSGGHSAADGVVCVNSTIGSGSWNIDRASSIIPDLWGADSSGKTDSTSALQKFFSFVSANHTNANCPAGTYKFTSQLKISAGNFTVDGTCHLNYAGSAKDIDLILIAGTANAHLSNIRMRGETVQSSTIMTAGDAVHLYNVDYSDFAMSEGDYPGQNRNLFDGIWFDTSSYNKNGGQVYVSHYGLNASRGVELDLDHFISNGNGDTGVHIGGGFGGVYFRYVSISCIYHPDGNINNYKRIIYMPVGLRIDASIFPQNNYQIFVTNTTTFDSCSAAQVYIDDTGTQQNRLIANGGTPTIVGLRSFSFDGWASGSHGVGIPSIYIRNWANGTFQVGGGANIINGAGSGILIDDPSVRLTIDPAAWIGQNRSYGVQCTLPDHNIQSDASWLTNRLGDYSPLCQGDLTKAAWLSYTPTVACTSRGGTLGTYVATGLYRMSGFTTDYQVEIKNSAAGNCTAITYSLPKDGTGQAKTPVAPFNFFGRNNSNGNLTVSTLGPGNINVALTSVTAGANLSTATSDHVISGTYMNNTGQ